MSKKMPKGYSVKTTPREAHLVTMYDWKIVKDGKIIKESMGATHMDSIDARTEGLEKMWDIISEES
jgi:hypothetical protein